jgi:hypothetical protein
MSPKTAKPVAAKEAKKSAPAKAEKSESKKAAKGAKAQLDEETAAPVEVSADEREEMEEQQEEAAASSGGGGGNAAALAAAAGSTEMSASFKNFRHHPDMENFYRFIYENDLRHEALALIDTLQLQKETRKMVKGAKAQAH